MIQIFGHLWVSNEGEPLDGGQPTENFLRWCKETDHFTGKHWKRAYERVEHDVREAARLGEKAYPPCSVRFIEYGQPVGSVCHNPFPSQCLLEVMPETQEQIDRRTKAGFAELEKMQSMFD